MANVCTNCTPNNQITGWWGFLIQTRARWRWSICQIICPRIRVRVAAKHWFSLSVVMNWHAGRRRRSVKFIVRKIPNDCTNRTIFRASWQAVFHCVLLQPMLLLIRRKLRRNLKRRWTNGRPSMRSCSVRAGSYFFLFCCMLLRPMLLTVTWVRILRRNSKRRRPMLLTVTWVRILRRNSKRRRANGLPSMRNPCVRVRSFHCMILRLMLMLFITWGKKPRRNFRRK